MPQLSTQGPWNDCLDKYLKPEVEAFIYGYLFKYTVTQTGAEPKQVKGEER